MIEGNRLYETPSWGIEMCSDAVSEVRGNQLADDDQSDD